MPKLKATAEETGPVKGARYVEWFVRMLEEVQAGRERGRRERHGLRQLGVSQYLGLFLLGVFDATIESMRGLCRASGLPAVQELLQTGPVVPSRFSEAQAVFDPALLEQVFSAALAECAPVMGSTCGGFPKEALRIIDSTLWKVVPRMAWATWRTQGVQQQAVRLHLKLRVLDEAPVAALVTTGHTCERKALLAMTQPGEIYVGDRYYGEDYGQLAELEQRGCGFLFRLRNNATVTWECEEALTPAERAAGIVQAGRARLGRDGAAHGWRVLVLERPGQEKILLVASACWQELPAGEISEFYRQRWRVEQFFRWLKCLVPCRHWFAHSQRGVTFQIYLILIASLLLAKTLGERPNRAMMELLQWHQRGWLSDADLPHHLARVIHERDRQRQRAKAKAAAKKAH